MSEKRYEGKEQTDDELYAMPVFTGLKDSMLPANFEGRIEDPAERFLDLKWGEKKTTFNNVYEAYDTAIESDSRLAGALENASESIFSLKSGVEPLGKDSVSKAVADWVKAYLDFMDDETGDGFMGVLENIYKSVEYSQSVSVCVTPKSWIEFNGLKVPPLWESRPAWLFQYNLIPPCDAELRKRLATGSPVGEPCEPNTIIAHSYKAQMPGRPYGRGLMFDLFPLAHIKVHLMAWAARFSEKYGMPIEQIMYAPQAKGVAKEMIKNQGANRYCIVEIPLGEDMLPVGSDPLIVKFIESLHNQMFVYGDFIRLIEEEYAFRTVGSTLTTGTSASGAGSYSQANVHLEVSNKVMAGRARYLERCLYKILKLIFAVNRAKVLPAKWKLYTEQVQMTPEKSQVVVALGLPLIKQEVYDGLGFTMPTDEDEVLLPPEQQPALNPYLASKAFTASKDSPIQRKIISPAKRTAQLKLQSILVKATWQYIDSTLFKAWQKMVGSLNVPTDPAMVGEKVLPQQLDDNALVDAAYTVFLNRYCLGYLLTGRSTATSAATASKIGELETQEDKILDAAAVLALYRSAIPHTDDEWNAVDQVLRDKALGFVESRTTGLKAKIAALATRALAENWDKKRFIDEAQKIIAAQRDRDYSMVGIGLGILWLGRNSQSMGEKDFATGGVGGLKKGKPGVVRAVFGYEWISDLSIPWENHHPGHGEANGYIGSLEAYEKNGDPEPGMVPNCLCDWRDVDWAEAVDNGWADWDGNILNHEPNGPFPADFEMGLL